MIGYPSRTISAMLGIPVELNTFLLRRRKGLTEGTEVEAWADDALAAFDLGELPNESVRFHCLAFAEIERQKVMPVFKMVDTCAGEFESQTPYYYGTFEDEDDAVDRYPVGSISGRSSAW